MTIEKKDGKTIMTGKINGKVFRITIGDKVKKDD